MAEKLSIGERTSKPLIENESLIPMGISANPLVGGGVCEEGGGALERLHLGNCQLVSSRRRSATSISSSWLIYIWPVMMLEVFGVLSFG